MFIFFKQTIGADTIYNLAEMLKDSPGSQKVYLAVPLTEKKFRKIETNFTVDASKAELIDRLSALAEVKFVKMM